jgi:copper chaperone NosL
MKHKLSPAVRTAALISACGMLLVLVLPIWQIQLAAPQYPEGLVLRIYAAKIGGDVDIVNGLNHYIGMHTLHTRDFVEFIALPYIIGGFAVLGFLVVLFNRKSLFYTWVGLFLLIAFTSMIDFYRWEYNYGHNLDPAAPIQVPGMAYQPPLIGYKQLLNFGAFSIPDIGGWIFAGVGVVLAVAAFYQLRQHRKTKKAVLPSRAPTAPATVLLAVFIAALSILTGCHPGPEPIRYGQDNCAFCKMTIADNRFGAEVCTRKGKVFKYDDFHCLLSALHAGTPYKKDIAAIYFVDFSGGPWIAAANSFLLHSESFHTPMGGNIAAFASEGNRHHNQQQLNAQATTWKELYP